MYIRFVLVTSTIITSLRRNKRMSEPDNRLIEAVVAFSEFEDKIIATGLRFDLQAAFWD